MNSVILIGRLTRKPELRYSNSGNQTAIARFSLAVDRPFSKDQERTADFINIVVFGNLSANFFQDFAFAFSVHGITPSPKI